MPAPDSLLAALSAGLTDPTDQLLVQSIFGTVDPAQIGQQICDLCRTLLNQEIAACEFWEVSVSFTIGLRLVSGQRVVAKFRSPANITLPTLQAVCQVQEYLANCGFPAPQIILPPIQQGDTFASIEALLDVGENCDAHNPLVRRAMAIGLAQQIRLAQPLVNLPHLPLSRFQSAPLWEKPHNALFDFERTAEGAEWIDGIAEQAKFEYSSTNYSPQIGHMDWSVKNMRFNNNQLSAVYDWDSLRVENELVILGNALKGFLTTWYVNVKSIVPTPKEINSFIQDYEFAREQAFTQTEQQIIRAAFLYSMAYTARCEHAIDPAGQKVRGSFREALRNFEAYM
jgi:hypothetical protein